MSARITANIITGGSTIVVKLDTAARGPAGISDLTGLITEGDNITITGTGTEADPFVITATVAWDDVTEKPAWTATFDGSYASLSGLPATFPPSAHDHPASAITDFNTAVAANSAVAANTAKTTNATHTGEVTGSGELTITTGAVTLAKMANMATASLIYRKTAGAGPPQVNTLATLKTDLGLTGTNTGDQDLTAYQLQPTEGPFVNGDKTKLDALPALAVENLIGTTSGGIVTTLVNAGEHVVLDVGGIVLDSSTGGIDCGAIKSFEYDFASTTIFNYTTATAAAHRLAMGASTLPETVINASDNEVALIVATHAFNYLVLQASAGVELRLDPGLSWPEDCIIYIRRDSECGAITFSTAGNFIAPTGDAVDDIEQNGTFAIRRRSNTSNWDFI